MQNAAIDGLIGRIRKNTNIISSASHSSIGEDLGPGDEAAISLLDGILERWLGRNERCPCGGLEKLKNCHLASFAFLKGMEQLRKDLRSFRTLLKGAKVGYIFDR